MSSFIAAPLNDSVPLLFSSSSSPSTIRPARRTSPVRIAASTPAIGKARLNVTAASVYSASPAEIAARRSRVGVRPSDCINEFSSGRRRHHPRGRFAVVVTAQNGEASETNIPDNSTTLAEASATAPDVLELATEASLSMEKPSADDGRLAGGHETLEDMLVVRDRFTCTHTHPSHATPLFAPSAAPFPPVNEIFGMPPQPKKKRKKKCVSLSLSLFQSSRIDIEACAWRENDGGEEEGALRRRPSSRPKSTRTPFASCRGVTWARPCRP